MTDGLVVWLRTQLDTDERGAKAAADPADQWWWSTPESPAEEHIARYSPARVLAEVDAKREILAKYQGALMQEPKRPDDQVNRGYLIAMSHAIHALALPYADRPGYRDEWRP